MKTEAIRCDAPGGRDQLQLRSIELAEPGDGQVRVRVEYAGVNFIDVYHRTGQYKLPLPLAIGLEGAGVVEAAGPHVALAVGARVAWQSVSGSYARHVIARADQLVPVPDALDTKVAAAAMLQGMTAHYLTRSTFPLASGHVAVLHAAAGGVGLIAAQLARAAGATVIGTVSTDAKAARARAAGCAYAVGYDAFVDQAKALGGAHVVYDSVGKDTFERGFACLRPRGMMVLFGQSSGAVPAFDPQLLNQRGSLFLTRPKLNDYVLDRAELLARAGAVLEPAAAGSLDIAIDRVLPLADAAEAHRLLESRETSGKLLLDAR